jgi:ABC-type multidrug transport system ATPase subunit
LIALEGVAARRKPLALASVSVAWEAGVHGVVGARSDGGPLLLALVAGLVRPRSGKVGVLGGAPTDVAVRKQVALVPLEPTLPDAMRVREALAMATAIRGEAVRDETARLARLGIEALADRSVRSLSRPEARAVALAEALTSTSVRVLLVEEPLLAMDPRAAGRVPEALRERGRSGCAVVVTTGSMRDASELADDWIVLRDGAIASRALSVDALLDAAPEGTHLRIVLRDPEAVPALVAALAREGEVDSIERDEAMVRLRGRDATELARAAGRAALEAGCELAELRVDAPVRSNGSAARGAP